MTELSPQLLWSIAPRFDGPAFEAQSRIIPAVAPHLESVLAAYDVSSPLRIAHFLAQITHECAHFRTLEEFASGEAYEGRADLGNCMPGDGVRYKGRGLIQLTGRRNYREIGARLGLDLEAEPDLALDPKTSLTIAAEYWDSRDINSLADQDDLIAVTRAINGGLNGLDDRRACLDRAKTALNL